MATLAQHPLSSGSQYWLFLLFAFAFLVKAPAFPLHGWMPDAYRQAPLPVILVFSAVVSKVGVYGFLRIVLPLLPQASVHFQELMLAIAVVSILYGSVLAFSQDEARLVLGYSSVAQLGFIVLGIFSLDPKGGQGAVLQMVNHGLVVAPLFLIIGYLAIRAQGRESLDWMGGMAFRAPVLAAVFLIVALATLAMPGSSNFVGELYILFGTFQSKIVYGLVASVGVVLAAVYMIRFYQRSMHNPVGAHVESRDLALGPELGVIAPLVLIILALGVYPNFLLHRINAFAPTNPGAGRRSSDDRTARHSRRQGAGDRLQGHLAAVRHRGRRGDRADGGAVPRPLRAARAGAVPHRGRARGRHRADDLELAHRGQPPDRGGRAGRRHAGARAVAALLRGGPGHRGVRLALGRAARGRARASSSRSCSARSRE